MKQILLVYIIFISVSCQGVIIRSEHRKARALMTEFLKSTYDDKFELKQSHVAHEFGKIYGYTFEVNDDSSPPHQLEFNLAHQESLEIDKIKFDELYAEVRAKRENSIELQKFMGEYFPHVVCEFNRIEENDSINRIVNKIDIGVPLLNNIYQLPKLDSIALSRANIYDEMDQIYNFYFSHQPRTNKIPIANMDEYFEFDNFENKHHWHYRVDISNHESESKILEKKLLVNLSEQLIESLKLKISGVLKQSNIKYKEGSLKLKYLIEDDPLRNIELKKFMYQGEDDNEYFGTINMENFNVKLE